MFATSWGIGTSPDSVAYIGSARNLAAGLGLTVPFGGLDDAPMTHHAPFYPALLGAIWFSGIDPAHVARILGAVIIAVNTLLAAWLVSRMVVGMNWPPVFAALLVGISPTILEIHSMAWTEPLFISLGFLGLGLLARGLENRSWKLSLIAALLVGLAALTRYAGVALIFSGILGILLLARVGVIHRLTYAAGFGMAAGLPLLVWVAYNILTVGTATSRSLNFHPIGRGQLWQGMASITSWLLIPENAPTWFHLATLTLLGLLISAALFIIWRGRNKEWTTPGITLSLIALFIPVYILFLVVSISLFDANTPLDGRILSPAFFAGVVCMVALLSWVKIQ
ncbi:MAG: glycosyltransferase family 39 protein, partial [Anaerolineales bacterium]|nr:glycosyltransferase family 39 protein [Anaerolineales bacterium]